MKPSIYRRIRRRTASHEAANTNKESRQESSFFGEVSHETFFQPSPAIQRKCDKCEEEDKKVQRQQDKKEEDKKLQRATDKKEEEKLQKKESADSPGSSVGVNNYVASLSGKGQSLSADANQYFSSKMGYDFSDVKIHSDKDAAQSAKDVNAKAYTVGEHVVFNEGQYNTESEEGKKLMAHELTHVMQQGNVKEKLNRVQDDNTQAQEPQLLPPVLIEGEGSLTQNTTHYANCAGVTVSGSTSANYGNSFSANGTPRTATTCTDCTGTDCITVSGTVVSVFTTNPSVSLPAVPSGLNECEQNAVRNFINTTLSAHEQQHVAAFNTYRGAVRTPFSFTGCRADLDAHVQSIHDAIEASRRAASDSASAQLDANGANQFTIACECPDPVPDAGTGKK